MATQHAPQAQKLRTTESTDKHGKGSVRAAQPRSLLPCLSVFSVVPNDSASGAQQL
jgi:hypothetical protein